MPLLYAGEGFVPRSGLVPRLSYSFLHANVWHLLANLLVLWSIRRPMNVAAAYVIAVAASYLPMHADRPTVGLSGLLFAMFGIMWGHVGDARGFLRAGMPVILAMMLIPGVNGLLHLYCYLVGFIVFKAWHGIKFK